MERPDTLLDSEQPRVCLEPNSLLKDGTYRIVSLLDEGGFGKTYIAEHIVMQRKVCIKEFFINGYCSRDTTNRVGASSPQFENLIDELKRKFIKEAMILAAMDHPNIVNVYDSFTENNTAYYVMEYIEGESLRNIIRNGGAMSENQALAYMEEIAKAVAYIHEHKMLHLDIKPSNIMVRNSDSRIVLIDFGLTKHYNESNGNQTSQSRSGTSDGYAPIEQYDGGIEHFSPETDIYALGATLFTMLTAQVPPKASVVDLSTLISPTHKLSARTQKAIKSAMQFNRKKRPHSVEEFMTILNNKRATNKKGKRPLLIALVITLISLSAAAILLLGGEKTSNQDIKEDRVDTQTIITEAKDLFQTGDEVAGFEKMMVAAEYGNQDAMLEIAKCYKLGIGTNTDINKAIDWYKRCAEKGNTSAMFNLGICYNEVGSNHDMAKAIEWYTKAAENNHAAAQFQLASIYLNGRFVDKDSERGFEWLTQSANNGYDKAQYYLGLCYINGDDMVEGMQPNLTIAVQWFERSAAQDHIEAIEALAECCENGWGTPKNRERADSLYKRAQSLRESH